MEGRVIGYAFDDDLGFRQQRLGAARRTEGPAIDVDRNAMRQEFGSLWAANLEDRSIRRDIDDRAEGASQTVRQRLRQRFLLSLGTDDEPFIGTEPQCTAIATRSDRIRRDGKGEFEARGEPLHDADVVRAGSEIDLGEVWKFANGEVSAAGGR